MFWFLNEKLIYYIIQTKFAIEVIKKILLKNWKFCEKILVIHLKKFGRNWTLILMLKKCGIFLRGGQKIRDFFSHFCQAYSYMKKPWLVYTYRSSSRRQYRVAWCVCVCTDMGVRLLPCGFGCVHAVAAGAALKKVVLRGECALLMLHGFCTFSSWDRFNAAFRASISRWWKFESADDGVKVYLGLYFGAGITLICSQRRWTSESLRNFSAKNVETKSGLNSSKKLRIFSPNKKL